MPRMQPCVLPRRYAVKQKQLGHARPLSIYANSNPRLPNSRVSRSDPDLRRSCASDTLEQDCRKFSRRILLKNAVTDKNQQLVPRLEDFTRMSKDALKEFIIDSLVAFLKSSRMNDECSFGYIAVTNRMSSSKPPTAYFNQPENRSANMHHCGYRKPSSHRIAIGDGEPYVNNEQDLSAFSTRSTVSTKHPQSSYNSRVQLSETPITCEGHFSRSLSPHRYFSKERHIEENPFQSSPIHPVSRTPRIYSSTTSRRSKLRSAFISSSESASALPNKHTAVKCLTETSFRPTGIRFQANYPCLNRTTKAYSENGNLKKLRFKQSGSGPCEQSSLSST